MVLTLAAAAAAAIQPVRKTIPFVVGMECALCALQLAEQQSDRFSSVAAGKRSGYADGYDVMIAKNIADQLGKELVIKQVSMGQP